MTPKDILYEIKDKHGIGTAWQLTEHVIIEAMEAYAHEMGLLPTPVEIWNKAKELNGVDFTTWYNSSRAVRVASQLCPKCNGQGIVSKPPWVAGDVHKWVSLEASFTCDLCNGAKTIPFVLVGSK